MRLTLVIHSLHGGGAEKTMALMASRWAELGHSVTLITLDSVGSDRYPLAAGVERVCLDKMAVSRSKLEAMWRNVTRVKALRRAIRATCCDHVISFTEKVNVLVLLASARLEARVIVCERTDPRCHSIGRAWSLLRRMTYRLSDSIVVQTDPIRDFVSQFAARVPIHVVPNCVWSQSLTNDLADCCDRPKRIIALGRLVASKGFDLLIRAFAEIAREQVDWELKIFGEGPERSKLESLIAELQLENRVHLPGWCAEPASVLSQAQVFVMSSLYEGFPNALLEAMAMGLAPISFDCESGPREIIRHEVDGILVPAQDVTALSRALKSLLTNGEQRYRIAAKACEVRDRFSESKYFEHWERILAAGTSRERGF